MQVTANWELHIYQVIGPVVRVHWDYVHTTGDDEFQGPYDIWTAQEAVVPVDADRETFVAIVNAEGGDGEALAGGWFV
jgi:pyruvate-formate lyase-activating enzyme